jgi:formylglycine-generating enzyme required for sulfatase activity
MQNTIAPYDFNACDAGYFFDGEACAKSDEIKDKTIVITSGEIDNLLTGFQEDQLIFAKTDRTSAFREGNIIAFSESDKYPKGYVAEIKTVEKDSNQVVIHTEIISPILAFKHLKLDIKKVITADPESQLFKNPTEEQLRRFSDEHHIYEPNKEFTKDFPFGQTWDFTYGTVTLDGNVNFSDLIELKADIFEKEVTGFNDYYLDELTFKNTLGLNIDVTLTAESKNLEPLLKNFNGKIFRKTFNIAEVPVTVSGITFRIKFDLTTRGDLASSLQGKATVTGSSHNTLMVGVGYKRLGYPRGTQFLHEFTSDNSVTGNVDIEGKASATLGLIPSMTIYAYTEKLFSINGKVDVRITPLEITSHMNASTEIGNDGVINNKVRACYRADGKLTASPSVTVKAIKKPFSSGYVLDKTFNFTSKEKAWSWIDFLKPGGYFGSCSGGCHEGLVCQNSKCRAKDFWSKVGHTDDTEFKSEYGEEEGWKCVQLVCSADPDCRISKQTADATCDTSGKCVYKPKTTDYVMKSISATTSFKRGCVSGDEECKSNENPVKTVKLKAYKIGESEVTNAQYKACVSARKCSAPANTIYNLSANANKPVTDVSWVDAIKFCAWKGGYRLPTEAEWEYAAKGSSGNKYPWTGSDTPVCTKTNMKGLQYLDRNNNNKPTSDADYVDCQEGSTGCLPCTIGTAIDCDTGFHKPQNPTNPSYGAGCGTGGTVNVKSKSSDKSAFGLYDMAGNVSEWTLDYYKSTYYSDSSSTDNPKGASSITGEQVSVRGGNYLHNGTFYDNQNGEYVDGGGIFRNSNRASKVYSGKFPDIGFRCAVYQ